MVDKSKDNENNKNRMDGQDLESHYGMYQEINRLCPLLCGGDGETIEGDGFGKVS
jgi:hypothetical protein